MKTTLNPSARIGIKKVLYRIKPGLFLAIVEPTSVLVDLGYQRPRSPGHVANIGKEYDRIAARVISLCLRNHPSFDGKEGQNKLYVTDGQHTVEVMALQGDSDNVVAQIATDLTWEQEAELFRKQNDSDFHRAVCGWNKYKAGLAGRNPIYVAWADIFEKYRLTTPFHPTIHKNKNADISTIGPINYAFKKGQLKLVERLCQVNDKAFRIGNRRTSVKESAKETRFLRGLTDFLATSTQTITSIVAVLKHVEPDQIRNIAHEMKSTGRIDSTQFRQAFESLCGHEGLTAAA